jgi:hypothetical protein
MKLTREESLELENIALRQQLLTAQVAELRRDERDVTAAIKARLGLAPDASIEVNRATGSVAIVTKPKERTSKK